jgi:hypothetical protein
MEMSESITDAFKCNQCGSTFDSDHDSKERQPAAHHALKRSGNAKDANQHIRAKNA